MTGPQPVDTDEIASTPDLLGYVLAVGISWVVASVGAGATAVLFELDTGIEETSSAATPWEVVLAIPGSVFDWSTILGLFALLSAPFGVLAVHLLCERFDPQWVHVLASGLVGVAAVLSASQLLLAESAWLMALGIGLSTAFGRAAVIPLVPVVQRRFPAGTPFWRRFSLS